MGRSRALGLLVGVASVLGLPGAAQALDTLPVPGNVGSDGMSLVASSCPSAGSCSAVAVYTDSGGNSQVALFDQVNGSWRLTELDLSHLAGLDASGDLGPESISCASAGNCAVVGYYQDASQTYQAFVAMETGGVWAPASEAQMPGNVNTTNYGVNHSGDEDLSLTSVACISAGNCTVFGDYDANAADNDVPFVLTESNASWAQAVEAPLPSDASPAYGELISGQVSCPPAGACTAFGAYPTTSGGEAPFVLTQSGSSWTASTLSLSGIGDPAAAPAQFQPAFGTNVLSCPSAGSCTAAGTYLDSSGGQQGVFFDESNGAWKATTADTAGLSLPSLSSQVVAPASVSCSSAGTCLADGVYLDSHGQTQGMSILELGGTWENARTVALPSDANTDPAAYPISVACSAAGNCVMPTFYLTNSNSVEQALQSFGELPAGLASVPLSASLTGTTPSDDGAVVACAADGYCSLLDTFPNSTSIVAMSAPGLVSAPTAQSETGLLSLNWSAPTDDGGLPIIGYSATSASSTDPTKVLQIQSATPPATALEFGLAPGKSYQLTVAATNALGVGIPWTSAPVRVLPSRAEVGSMLGEIDWPSGPKANLKAIRRARGFSYVDETTEPGTLSIIWVHKYATGHGKHRVHHQTTVAAGTLKIASVGRFKINLKLTAAGEKLVKADRKLTLTSKLTFTSPDLTPFKLSRTFTLR